MADPDLDELLKSYLKRPPGGAMVVSDLLRCLDADVDQVWRSSYEIRSALQRLRKAGDVVFGERGWALAKAKPGAKKRKVNRG